MRTTRHSSTSVASNTSHRRDRTITLKRELEEVRAEYPEETVGLLFGRIAAEKPCYLHDSIRMFRRGMEDVPRDTMLRAVSYCLENGVYNTATAVEVAQRMAKEKEREERIPLLAGAVPHTDIPSNMVPAASSIGTYTNIINK